MGARRDHAAAAAAVKVVSPPSPPIPSSSGLVSPTSSSSPLQPPAVIASPCAACKILRRRCAEKCVLAPYFPPTEPLKFTIAHRVFGASNIIKFLQELPESQRADAVSSMVYEANARIRDPVYGCAGAICQLQKQVSELQAQLAKAQAEIVNLQAQLTAQISATRSSPPLPLRQPSSLSLSSSPPSSTSSPEPAGRFPCSDLSSSSPPAGCYLEDNGSLGSYWETLDMIFI